MGDKRLCVAEGRDLAARGMRTLDPRWVAGLVQIRHCRGSGHNGLLPGHPTVKAR